MELFAAAARVLTPDGALRSARVSWDSAGIITSVEPTADAVPDLTLAPGFIDLQVNGHKDVDVARAQGEEWARLDAALLRQGVTAWCPTLVSAPLDVYEEAFARIAVRAASAAGPTVLGVHLEGPFLTVPGAHDVSALRDPEQGWLAGLPTLVRVVTLAPERDGALEVVQQLAHSGRVAALGHSAATKATAEAAADRGARLVTHVFNAMPPLHHRQLGLVGAALTDDRLVVSVVADGWHVDPGLLRLIARAKGDGGWLLVTDAVAWEAGGTPTMPVSLQGGVPRRPDGTLAGSAARMDECVRACVAAGVPLVSALSAASRTPAAVLGERDRGVLAVGMRADLVALDADLKVRNVWLAGQSQGLDL